MTLHPYCAAAPGNRTKAGCFLQGKERNGRPATGPLPRQAIELRLLLFKSKQSTPAEKFRWRSLSFPDVQKKHWGRPSDSAWGAKRVGEKPSFSPRGPVSGRPDSLCLSSYNLPGAGAQYDCPGTGPEITRRQCRKSLKRISGSLHRSEGSGPPGVEMGRRLVYNRERFHVSGMGGVNNGRNKRYHHR